MSVAIAGLALPPMRTARSTAGPATPAASTARMWKYQVPALLPKNSASVLGVWSITLIELSP